MLPIKKQFVTDEAMRPVAVLIDDRDWQKIEELLKTGFLWYVSFVELELCF